MDEGPIITISVIVGFVYSVFNILTLSIFCLDKQLRHRPANYPVVSFLIGSALQGLVPAPLYVYKILKHRYSSEVPGWMCDTYRFPYIFCGHIMEFSIMCISVDRLVAVKYPFHYPKEVTKLRTLCFLALGWLGTISVDVIPFFSGARKTEQCQYVPTRLWGLLVIIIYNILPFFIVVVNYSIIWTVARVLAVDDRKRADSVRMNCNNSCKNKDGAGERSAAEKQLLDHHHNKHHHESMVHKTMCNLKFTLEMKATKTSLAIVGVYLVCWIPMGIFYMADHFCHNCISEKDSLKDARRAVKILAFSSSILAPLIYCWWNHEFRKAAKKLCGRKSSTRNSSNKALVT